MEERLASRAGRGEAPPRRSRYVQKGFQMLADPGSFDSNTFTLLLRAAFQSLLDAQADEAVLGKPLGSELDRPGWRGAQRRGARPSEKGKAPGRGSLRALPFAPDGVWDVVLPEPTADPDHCSLPTWHLHTASYTFLV